MAELQFHVGIDPFHLPPTEGTAQPVDGQCHGHEPCPADGRRARPKPPCQWRQQGSDRRRPRRVAATATPKGQRQRPPRRTQRPARLPEQRRTRPHLRKPYRPRPLPALRPRRRLRRSRGGIRTSTTYRARANRSCSPPPSCPHAAAFICGRPASPTAS